MDSIKFLQKIQSWLDANDERLENEELNNYQKGKITAENDAYQKVIKLILNSDSK